MMKKSFLPLFLMSFLLSSVFVFAKEESSSPPVAVNPVFGERAVVGVPLEFSVSPGKWSQAQRGEIFTTGILGADFVLPSLKEEPIPIRYPRWAVREGWEGTFVIAIEVLATGEVGRWKVMESTGYSLLDQAAIGVIRKWRFHPAMERGQTIVSCIEVPIHFELQD